MSGPGLNRPEFLILSAAVLVLTIAIMVVSILVSTRTAVNVHTGPVTIEIHLEVSPEVLTNLGWR